MKTNMNHVRAIVAGALAGKEYFEEDGVTHRADYREVCAGHALAEKLLAEFGQEGGVFVPLSVLRRLAAAVKDGYEFVEGEGCESSPTGVALSSAVRDINDLIDDTLRPLDA